MFDTANAALGGSKTADNLADAADMNQFDPSVISKLVKGDPIGAVTTGVAKALGTMTGSPPSVMEKVAKALIDTNPDAAFNILSKGSKKLTQSDQIRAKVAAALVNSGAVGSGRLAP
jgi:predicted nucleic acid-binding protein